MLEGSKTIAASVEESPILGGARRGLNVSRPWALAVALAALASFSLYAHIELLGRMNDYRGWLAIFLRTFDLLLAGAILCLAFCIGRTICERLALNFHNIAEEWSFSVAFGTGALGLSLLMLGLVGLLRPIPVATLLVILTAICARKLRELYCTIADTLRSGAPDRSAQIVGLLFVLFLSILVLRAATPPHSYDEAIYHLSVARQFAMNGRVYPMLDNWAGNMPFLVQMVYASCLLFGSDIATKLFSVGLAVSCSVSLYGFCARFLNRRTGTIAMIGFFGAGMIVEVGTTSRIDVTLAFMTFLATYAMIAYLETHRVSWLRASAVLCGLALGIKYTAGVWLALLVAMFLLESLLTSGDRLRFVLKRGISFLILAGAIASPWFIKNLIWFHNPVYPFVTGEALEAADGRVRYFGVDDDRQVEAQFQTAQAQLQGGAEALERELSLAASRREERHPFRVWEYFIYPDKYNMAEPYHDPNNLFLITPLLVFFRKSRWAKWLALLAVAFYAAVINTSWVGRILLPVYPVMTVVAAYVIVQAAEWAKSRVRFGALLPALSLVVALGPVTAASVSQMRAGGDLDFIIGERSRREYMYGAFYYPAIDYINQNLPANARVLMIGAQMCYDLRRDYVADVNWDTTEWRRLLARNASIDDVNNELKARGVTHVLFSPSLFWFAAQVGHSGLPRVSGSHDTADPDYRPQLITLATFDLYRRKFLEQIYADRLGYLLYEIR